MKKRTNAWRVHALVLAVCAVLSLIFSWPLVAKLGTHVPGIAQWAFDESTFIWNIWMLKAALVDTLSNPLHSELIYYPLGIDLILYTYNFFHALFAQPLMLALNLPAASNLTLLFSTVFSGYGTFLLLVYLLRKLRPTDVSSGRFRALIYLGAFVGGIAYAFASNRAIYAALGHYDMVTTQWIPFYALMLLRMVDGTLSANHRRHAAVLAGVFFAFNGLAEMITAVFLAIFTVIVLVDYSARLWGARRTKNKEQRTGSEDVAALGTAANGETPTPADLRSSIFNLFILGITAFLLWGLVLVPVLNQFLTDNFSLKGWGEAIPLSTDLLGWFTPTTLHPIFGGDLITELRRVQLRALEMGVTGFRDLNTVFLGWITLAVALVGVFAYRSKVRIWIWTSIIFGLFTLGPFLQINGEYQFDLDGVDATFPLPYALLHYVPIVKANRAPNRNSVLLMLGLAVLVGYGLFWVMGKLEARRKAKSEEQRSALDAQTSPIALGSLIFALCIALLIIFEHLTIPAPLSDARIPAVYEQIAADPDAVSVMQVPLGWRNSFGVLGPERTQLQYYQTTHGKPMLGGNISRAPDFKMGYFERIPFFNALTQVEFGAEVAPETLEAAQAQAAELMYLYNTEYVLLYPPIPERYPYVDHWQSAWDWVRTTVPLEDEPFWAEDGIEAYRVVQPEGEDRFMLALGETGTFPYRGEGWDEAEVDQPYETPATWAIGQNSRLFVPLRQVDPDATYNLTMRLRPFAYPGSVPQTVAAAVNGVELASQTLSDDWQEVSWPVSGDELIDGLNRIELTWGHTASPREVIGGSRMIGETGVELPVDADIKAFADGAFMAIFDEAGEQTDASAGRRGINVTVLDEKSGEVLEKTGFDTAANAYESQAMVDFLAGVDEGRIVLVASSGDATAYLTEEAIAGLQALGAGITHEQLAGSHFAVVGVQGAAPGTAAISIDPNEAFLRISLNRDRRPLAAAVDWVEVQR